MSNPFGAPTVTRAGPQRSFRNVASNVVSFSVSGTLYTLLPETDITLPALAAGSSTDIATLLANGTLVELVVYGQESLAPIPVASSTASGGTTSFSAAALGELTGSFAGISIDPGSSRWLLADGNRIIYPNSRPRQQPAAGPNSAVTIAATCQRLSAGGSFGFALYTDAGPTDRSFNNGYLVEFEQTGLAEIYSVTGGVWVDSVDRSTQTNYPLDLYEHTYAAIVQQLSAGSLKILAYVDGTMVSQATFTSNLLTNGTIGFSTAAGAGQILIVPQSFRFTIGADPFETMPSAARNVLTNTNGSGGLNVSPVGGVTNQLPQLNHDPAVLSGAVTGTSRNLIADSPMTYPQTYWNSSVAGSLAILAGAGLSGGNGIVLNVPAGPNGAVGQQRYVSLPIQVSPGLIYTFSGSLDATNGLAGGTGLPAWELRSPDLATLVIPAPQALGTVGRVTSGSFQMPGGVTSVVAVAATNNVAVSGGGKLVFSEPQLEMGPYMTAYSPSVMGNTPNLPLGVAPIEVITCVVPNGSGGGALLLGNAQPGSYMPYIVLPAQVSSTIGSVLSAQGTYVAPNTITNATVNPNTIAGSQALPAVYTDATANAFNNLSSSFKWYLTGTGAIDSSTTIGNGSTIVYSVTTIDPSPNPIGVPETLTLAANSSCTAIWNHPAMVATVIGGTKLNFSGAQQSISPPASATSSFSDNSSPTVTVSSQVVTTTPLVTGGVADTGNPSITSISNPSTGPHPYTGSLVDSETTTITTVSAGSTVTSLVSGTVPTTNSNPVIGSFQTQSTIQSATATTFANTSTPQVSATSTPGVANQLFPQPLVTVNNSSTATINTTFHAATNQPVAGTPTNISDQPYISQVDKPTQSSNDIAQPNANGTGSTATATITFAQGSTSAVSTGNITMGPVTTVNVKHFGGPGGTTWYETKTTYGQQGNSTILASSHIVVPRCNPPVAGHPLTLNYVGLPGNLKVGLVDDTSQNPDGSGGITDSRVNVAINWTARLYNDLGTLILITTSLTGTGTYSTGAITDPQNRGSYYWTLTPQWNSDPGGAAGSGSNSVTGSAGTSYWTGSGTYQQGSVVVIGSTPTATQAPVDFAHQIQYVVGTVTNQTINGVTSGVYLQLLYPNGTLAQQWNYVTSGQNVVFYSAGAPGGQYTWQYFTVLPTLPSVTTSYMSSITGTMWHFELVQTHHYTYPAFPGNTKTIFTGSGNVGPGPSTPLTLALTNLSCPSDGNGTTFFDVSLVDPNGTVVQTWNYITVAVTLTWATAGVGGSYQWQITGNVTSNSVNAETYTASLTGTAGWYKLSPAFYTYTTTNGLGQNYPTASSTLAPVNTATQLSLVLSNTVCPTDTYGSAQYAIDLYDPNNVIIQHYQSTGGTITYSAPGAIAGIYTWTVYAVIATNNDNATANQSYPCSTGVTISWYQQVNITNTTYTNINGATTSYYTDTSTSIPSSQGVKISVGVNSITAPSDANGSVYYTLTLFDPNGVQVRQVSGINVTGNALNYFTGSIGGVYRLDVYAYCTNTGTAGEVYSTTAMNFTLNWYDDIVVYTTHWTNTPGVTTNFYTNSSTVAPTSPATQLSFNISSLVAHADANGASEWDIVLVGPSQNIARVFPAITTAQTIVYFDTNASAGQYTWELSSSCTNTGTATETYSNSIAGTLYWYQPVIATQTSYNITPGNPSSITTGSSALAPINAGVQLSFVMNSIATPASAGGNSFYVLTLTNNQGTVVASWPNLTSTGQGPLNWFSPSARAGQYTWTLYATSALSGTPGNATFSCSMNATAGWYQNLTTYTTIYTPVASTSIQNTVLSSSTLAPVSSASQLSYIPLSLSLPSTSAGATQYSVTLKNPTGGTVQNWTLSPASSATLIYFNSGAPAGAYTWVTQAVCTTLSSGTAMFATALSARVSSYQSLTQTLYTYINNDGAGAQYHTPSNTTAPTAASAALSLTLNTIVTPSNSAGSSFLTVHLLDPNNVLIGAATTTNIVGSAAPVTITYSASAAISGSYTWIVYGQCSNTHTAATSFLDTWSGSHQWYQPSSTLNAVYIIAHDQVTKRLSCNDSDVNFTQLNLNQAQFQITNGASVPLTFSLGIQSIGF